MIFQTEGTVEKLFLAKKEIKNTMEYHTATDKVQELIFHILENATNASTHWPSVTVHT